MGQTAKQEIEEFLNSKLAGIRSSFKEPSLDNALKQMFTAKGLDVPVRTVTREGATYLINMDIVRGSQTQT